MQIRYSSESTGVLVPNEVATHFVIVAGAMLDKAARDWVYCQVQRLTNTYALVAAREIVKQTVSGNPECRRQATLALAFESTARNCDLAITCVCTKPDWLEVVMTRLECDYYV